MQLWTQKLNYGSRNYIMNTKIQLWIRKLNYGSNFQLWTQKVTPYNTTDGPIRYSE